MKLKINEIFKSIQGETSFVGLPCVFVRLSGCNLRCSYCDTDYAFDNGKEVEISNIIETVKGFQTNLVCVTGGEPLLQEGSMELIKILNQTGYTVLVETNGSINIEPLNENIIVIMDIKCPGSDEADKMELSNLQHLNPNDEVKFIMSSHADYKWAIEFIDKHELDKKARILFGAVSGLVEPAELAKWMLDDNVNARLQIQLHKFLGIN